MTLIKEACSSSVALFTSAPSSNNKDWRIGYIPIIGYIGYVHQRPAIVNGFELHKEMEFDNYSSHLTQVQRFVLGSFVLILVDVIWVSSSELTKVRQASSPISWGIHTLGYNAYELTLMSLSVMPL